MPSSATGAGPVRRQAAGVGVLRWEKPHASQLPKRPFRWFAVQHQSCVGQEAGRDPVMISERPPPPSDSSPDAGGEWLFQRSGQVFGPVPAHALVQMLYKGELTAATPVAGDDGAFRPLSEIPAFLVHVKKAEAQFRVEAEVTGARLLKRRRRILRGSAVALVASVLLGLGGYGAHWLATEKPWQKRSALLEDFGGGIQLVMAARVGSGRHAAAMDEVEVPVEPAPGEVARPSRRHAPAAHTGGGKASGEGDLVAAAQYDVTQIQAVVAREQRTLAPCLRAEAEHSPDFRGEIPLEFAIGNDGRVAQLWIDEPRFKHGPLHDCLLRALRTWPFKPFPGQRPTVSLSFRIGAR